MQEKKDNARKKSEKFIGTKVGNNALFFKKRVFIVRRRSLTYIEGPFG